MAKRKLEVENLIEEAKEIFAECRFCGVCKGACPVFDILREEAKSPRGFVSLGVEGVLDRAVFQCALCGACEIKCPKGIKIREGVLKLREALNIEGKNTKLNKERLNKLRKKGIWESNY